MSAPKKDERGDGPVPERYRRRAVLGVIWMILRIVAIQVVVLGGNVVLARKLDPGDFGVFAIVQFALTLFQLFADGGIGIALVQKKEEPTERELAMVFTAQILLSLGLFVVVGSLAHVIRSIWPDLPEGSEWLLRALSVSMLVMSLRTVSGLLMQREMQFGRLAALDVIHSVSFNLAAIALAFRGLHVWALVGAVLIEVTVGTAVGFLLRPWRLRLAWPEWGVIKPLIAYGIPFQLKGVWNFAQAAIIPAFAGPALGATAVGLIRFAMDLAYFPVKLVDVMTRVSFPLLSKMQSNRAGFAATLERAIGVSAAGTFFCSAIFLGMGTHLVRIIYSMKWLPAVPLLHLYAASICVGFLSPLIATGFDAKGRPQHFAKLMFWWVLLDWAIVPVATHFRGIEGFVAGHAAYTVIANVMAIVLARWVTPEVRIGKAILAPLVAAIPVAIGAWILGHGVVSEVRGVVASIVGLALLFTSIVFACDTTLRAQAIAVVTQRRLFIYQRRSLPKNMSSRRSAYTNPGVSHAHCRGADVLRARLVGIILRRRRAHGEIRGAVLGPIGRLFQPVSNFRDEAKDTASRGDARTPRRLDRGEIATNRPLRDAKSRSSWGDFSRWGAPTCSAARSPNASLSRVDVAGTRAT